MTTAVTDVKASPGRPMLLEAASPNPFSAATSIGYSLPEAGRSRLAVYDVLGRQVALLHDGAPGAGRHEVRWGGRDHDGRALPAGTYFIRLEFNGRSEARKVVLAR
jgi:flagellar hook assembly protein FlgD